jgi:hypothetical protein
MVSVMWLCSSLHRPGGSADGFAEHIRYFAALCLKAALKAKIWDVTTLPVCQQCRCILVAVLAVSGAWQDCGDA